MAVCEMYWRKLLEMALQYGRLWHPAAAVKIATSNLIVLVSYNLCSFSRQQEVGKLFAVIGDEVS